MGGGSNNSFSTGDLPLYKMFGDFATNTGIAGQFGEIRGYDAELSPAQILQTSMLPEQVWCLINR